jgi:hypothetical protein
MTRKTTTPTPEELMRMPQPELEAWVESAPTARWRRQADIPGWEPAAPTVPVTMRMPTVLLTAIKALAATRGVKYQPLIYDLLTEALRTQPDHVPDPEPVSVIDVDLDDEDIQRLASGRVDLVLRPRRRRGAA